MEGQKQTGLRWQLAFASKCGSKFSELSQRRSSNRTDRHSFVAIDGREGFGLFHWAAPFQVVSVISCARLVLVLIAM